MVINDAIWIFGTAGIISIVIDIILVLCLLSKITHALNSERKLQREPHSILKFFIVSLTFIGMICLWLAIGLIPNNLKIDSDNKIYFLGENNIQSFDADSPLYEFTGGQDRSNFDMTPTPNANEQHEVILDNKFVGQTVSSDPVVRFNEDMKNLRSMVNLFSKADDKDANTNMKFHQKSISGMLANLDIAAKDLVEKLKANESKISEISAASNVTNPGLIGDSFGMVNSFFSGLALAGIVLAILFQSIELKYQYAEMKNTRDVFMNTYHLQAMQTYMSAASIDIPPSDRKRLNMVGDLIVSIGYMRRFGEVNELFMRAVWKRVLDSLAENKILTKLTELSNSNDGFFTMKVKAEEIKKDLVHINENNVGNGILEDLLVVTFLINTHCEELNTEKTSAQQKVIRQQVTDECIKAKKIISELSVKYGDRKLEQPKQETTLRFLQSIWSSVKAAFKSS